MSTRRCGATRISMLLLGAALVAPSVRAHVTLRTNQPLRPKGFATVSLVVPNERHVDTTRIMLEVPAAFLKAGGRLSRVEYAPGWQVQLEKEDKPGDIYSREMEERSRRQAGADRGAKPAKSEAEQQEQKVLDELRKKWIKKITLEGSIPPDGFKVFLLSFELPDNPGEFRFPAVQYYADGKEVSWSELVQGAEHPAASITVERSFDVRSLAFPLSLIALLLALFQLIVRAVQRNRTQPESRTPAYKA